MRSWSAFLALCAAYLVVGIGVRLRVATFPAAEVPAVLVMIGTFRLDFVDWAVPIPIIARAVVLTTKSLGLRGIPKVATIEGYPLTGDLRLVSAENAEVGSVTAVCRRQPYSNGRIRCQMRREIADDISLYWEIGLPPDTMDEGLLRAETNARSVCSSLFNLPGCDMVPGTAP